MEMAEYIIFGFCILELVISYNIGFREGMDKGVRMGAGLMWEKLWSMGKPKRNPQLEQLNLREMNMGVYDMHTTSVITNAKPTTTQSNTEKEW